MGKLPKGQEHNLPGLKERRDLEERLARYEEKFGKLEEETNKESEKDDKETSDTVKSESSVPCPVEGCDFSGKNLNGLRLHSVKHEDKK